MSPSALQPDHAAPVIQELFEWVPTHCIKGTNGPSATPNRPFMPLPDLEAYLKAETRTSKLLKALYYEREHQVIVDILEKWYIRVFTILTLIGKGRYIEHFVQHQNLRDNQLPFLKRPAHFPTDPNDPKFWDSFCEKQFDFCPHYFRYNWNHTQLEDHCVLPIISKEVLGHGGSAAIYKIKLHPFYDQLSPTASDSRANCARPANTYVLKTYNTKDADSYYTSEVDAFKKLATKKGVDESLIQFLGSYKQGDTYNILLEYADRGTLEDFFGKVPPPSLSEDIVMFWGRFFNVIQALVRIHGTERPEGFRGPDILIGWHQDVKPSNILILSGKSGHPYDVEFKLADLGLSHFKRTAKLDRKIADSDVGGTKDYGAPECYRSDEFLEKIKLNVKSSIDIWSFGGVCSEAAVWVVLGMSGLISYRDQRRQEICEKGTSQDGSCFHDGEKVLETVKNMHNRLLKKEEVRPGDHVTVPVLDHMVGNMLEEDPDGRQNATWLWKKSQRILGEARTKLEEPPTTPKQVDSTCNNSKFYGLMPETPSPPLQGVPQSNGNHQYGPPPNDTQYSSNSPPSGRSSSVKQPQKPLQKSDTWHQNGTKRDMTPGSFHESPSPPIPNRQLPRPSPPVVYSAPDDTGDPFRSTYFPLQGTRDFPTRETESVARVYPAQRTQNGSAPEFFQNNDASGPPLESNSQHSKVAELPQGYEKSYPTPGVTSGKASQRTPPETPAEQPAQNAKPEKPFLSYDTARQIRESRGVLPQHHRALLNDLKDRDHVFLMDDSLSMKAHWKEVVLLFSVFGYFTKRLDDDSLEMYFTVSKDIKYFKDTTPAVSHLNRVRHSAHSNIDLRLDQILGKYQSDLERQKLERQKERKGFFGIGRSKVVKPLSLYVFTDAAWPSCDAVAPIEAMVEKLKQLELSKRQVGIQFVRFGNDPTGIQRLKHLDSGLRKKNTKDWDIVDTEPRNGNLLKMLLGAISNWFDDDPD